tara:strand:- start:3276 stop:4742 length:1467 start_codon:yes stop_codon:yes gene_type:complete
LYNRITIEIAISKKTFKLSELFKEEKLYRLSCYLLFLIICLNSVFNIIQKNRVEISSNINFFDLTIGILLFIFLYLIGSLVKEVLQFDSVSIGVTSYLFSFFITDSLILFFYQKLTFSEILMLVNLLWLTFFIFKLKNFKSILQIFLSLALLRSYFDIFISNLTINNNIRGDVEAIFFNQAKNIYEGSYFNSINNYIFEGYPQFLSYIQSIFLGLSTNISEYNFYSFTSHIVFYLSILFFVELKISKFHKFFLITLFSLLLLNSSFLKFLFTTSLMSEGLVSLFTAITVVSVLNNLSSGENVDYKLFLLLGLMYFSKQFNSSLVLILIILLYFISDRKKAVLLGFSGIALKELLHLFVFTEVNRDHHISQIDIGDTVLDLLLFRDLKVENIFLILKNLWIDKPMVILFFIFYFSYIYSKIFVKKFELQTDLIFILINLNIIFVFLIYISVWQNMELESPIRYFLNNLHLLMLSIFLKIDKTKKIIKKA